MTLGSEDGARVLEALTASGIEIYRSGPDGIRLAERVRMHLMDSGVWVAVGEPHRVCFAARCQRSDFPTARPEDLFERVRHSTAAAARAAGFTEEGFGAREIVDPMDETNVLDTWYEVVFVKPVHGAEAVCEAASWALACAKYVGP